MGVPNAESSFSAPLDRHRTAEDDKFAYYRRRASKARQMAATAIDPGIKPIHLAMAREYQSKIEQSAIKPARGKVTSQV